MRLPEDELTALKQASLFRHRPAPVTDLVNFSSNDYLGLSNHPSLIEAFQEAAAHFGVGSTASRLVCGSTSPHNDLEDLIAEAKGTEAAISFANGYATSVGVLPAVLQKGDTVIMDKLCHASLIDGARMSQATIRIFPHNNLDKLSKLLASTTQKASEDSRILVVTESVFSMDGDLAPLEQICSMTKKHNALLMVDEAHALGIIGPTGMGLAEELKLTDEIDFHMGTLGKAAGVAGGYLAASKTWISLIINRARSLIYSTAPPPAQAAAAIKAIELIRSEEGDYLRRQLWANIAHFQMSAKLSTSPTSAIIPCIVGDNTTALALSAKLKYLGFLVPAIRYPTVPRNSARLRITLNPHHSKEEITQLANHMISQI